jgi:LPS export ABC transporter protein LptC
MVALRATSNRRERMRRTRLRAGLLVVVAAALGGIGYEVSRTVGAHRARTLADLGSDFLPTVAQHIRSFRRIKVEKGRTLWEITARDAQYFDKQDEIIVREPQITFYLADGVRRAHVSGAEGRLVLAGRELKTFTLRGGVTVRLDDLEVETGEATYDRARDLITSPGPVRMRGRTLDVSGRGMEVQVTPQHVRLLEDVHTTVRSDAAPS